VVGADRPQELAVLGAAALAVMAATPISARATTVSTLASTSEPIPTTA
jgi:hypothetical protein